MSDMATDKEAFASKDADPKTFLDHIIKISKDKTLISDGPLSAHCAQALHHLYGKEVDEDSGITLETQANDAIVNSSIWLAAATARNQLSAQGQSVGLFYGVNQDEIGSSDVVSVTDSIAQMTDSEKPNSIIFINAKLDTDGNEVSGPSETESPSSIWEAAIEEIAAANGIRVIKKLSKSLIRNEG